MKLRFTHTMGIRLYGAANNVADEDDKKWLRELFKFHGWKDRTVDLRKLDKRQLEALDLVVDIATDGNGGGWRRTWRALNARKVSIRTFRKTSAIDRLAELVTKKKSKQDYEL